MTHHNKPACKVSAKSEQLFFSGGRAGGRAVGREVARSLMIKKRGVASDAPFLDNLWYTNYDEERPSGAKRLLRHNAPRGQVGTP